MADHDEFFDELYQQWSQTTGAKDTFWMPVQSEEYPDLFKIKAVDPNEQGAPGSIIAEYMSEEDADFICGLHGAIPDLIRHLGEATDRADRLDEARDRAEGIAADALLAVEGLKEEIRSLEAELDR
ncbi:hypothetical protein SEA_RAHALELUJAH_39 [Mycobacterium phage Rahalelujah]|nr:hypothetical protein SEA_RAHALELUJAH_39 [Mycobacterium phage Rahalelujah]